MLFGVGCDYTCTLILLTSFILDIFYMKMITLHYLWLRRDCIEGVLLIKSVPRLT